MFGCGGSFQVVTAASGSGFLPAGNGANVNSQRTFFFLQRPTLSLLPLQPSFDAEDNNNNNNKVSERLESILLSSSSVE